MPIEKPLVFYWRFMRELVSKGRGYWSIYWRYKAIFRSVKSAPDRWTYTDLAITPQPDEFEDLDLYHATTGGEAALDRKHRDDAIRAGSTATQLRPVAVSATVA